MHMKQSIMFENIGIMCYKMYKTMFNDIIFTMNTSYLLWISQTILTSGRISKKACIFHVWPHTCHGKKVNVRVDFV